MLDWYLAHSGEPPRFAGWCTWVLVLPAILAAGCVSTGTGSQRPPGPQFDPRLLTGETVFDVPVAPSEAPQYRMLEVTDAMRSFVRSSVGNAKQDKIRFERLLRGMDEAGYLATTYDAGRTQTAAETFYSKTGNCLSFTNLFVALARTAGLTARYQIVDVPETWDADAEYLIRYTHINVLLDGIDRGASAGNQVTVDFNAEQAHPIYPRRVVSEDHAIALFYSNRSLDQLIGGDEREGFALLVRALELAPHNADLWLNLGAFYAKHDQPDMAVLANQVALNVDPESRGAMSGLARGYLALGEAETAARYAERIRGYRERNPYYHFAVAQARYDDAAYAAALEAIHTAIRLERRDPRFHFMKGLVELRLGEPEAARTSFRRAQQLGPFQDLKAQYLRDLTRTQTDAQPG